MTDFMLNAVGGVILPLIGRHQPVRKNTQDCLRRFYAGCKHLDNHLRMNKYLVGNNVTIADIFTVGMILFGVKVFHKVLQVDYPALIRWFHEVHEIPMFKDIVGEFQELPVPLPTLTEDE